MFSVMGLGRYTMSWSLVGVRCNGPCSVYDVIGPGGLMGS